MRILNLKLKLTAENFLIILILVIAFLLRTYRLNELMPFIGDHAWFYLSARDMILTGDIPLVGIASSHTWVHQGALWTYLLTIPLSISNFNPISGAYLTAIIGAFTVFLIQKIGTVMFSKVVGLVAAVLYATSPLVIIHSRIPYHTSLIPLFSLLFIFFLYRWLKGDTRFLPFVFLTLGILYNLELATMSFWILLVFVFVYGAVKKERWFREAMKPKILLSRVSLFLLIMLPMIIYDFREHSGFYQTTAFFRLIKIYLLAGIPRFSYEEMHGAFSTLLSYNERLVFLGNGILAATLTLVSFFYLLIHHSGKKPTREASRDSGVLPASRRVVPRMTARNQASFWQVRQLMDASRISTYLLILWITIPLFGIVVTRTASEAYIPILFPAIILPIAILVDFINKKQAIFAVILILFISIVNGYLLISKNYLMGITGGYGLPFSERVSQAKEIIKKANGREYNLIGKGEESEHKSFTMNYEYLTWWLGYPPSKNTQELKFVIKK